MAASTMWAAPFLDGLGIVDALFLSLVGGVGFAVPVPGGIGAFHFVSEGPGFTILVQTRIGRHIGARIGVNMGSSGIIHKVIHLDSVAICAKRSFVEHCSGLM